MPSSRAKVLWVPGVCALSVVSVCFPSSAASSPVASTPSQTAAAIPWSQLGAKAKANYQGDGLAVLTTSSGVCLRCVFQRLEGEATSEGLWLTSTVTNSGIERFRVVAAGVRRLTSIPNSQPSTLSQPLPRSGVVSVRDQAVRFARPGLLEEYSVGMDGVRQDFLITQRPVGDGELQVLLDVSGARLEATAYGAQLVLENSGRKIAYSRLRVTDANGRELPARIEVVTEGSAAKLAIVVKDASATYPVRIDPTFSDANWISMGGVSGVDGFVNATVTDESGNLYIGGKFTIVGDVFANRVAKWNGSSWSALGAGMDNEVFALALSGDDLYAGGKFTTADGGTASRIAQWNGSSWSSLGAGMNNDVNALAISGGIVFAAGRFTAVTNNGGVSVPANYIAQWDGSSWTVLGVGMNGTVYALAASGNDLFAGGFFTTAGGNGANRIAKWNGTNWATLGLGANGTIYSLAVSGNTLFAGGSFTSVANTVGPNVSANYIAQWDGANWSQLGAGMGVGGWVYALAASGGDVIAGGHFQTAGGGAANNIAKWDGSSWSPIGSGMNFDVRAVAIHGNALYAGGYFSTADGVGANSVAQWHGSQWSSLGAGQGNAVNALAVSGSDLYAGGQFTVIGGVPARRIAKWNGSNWSALGSGFGAGVYALAVSGNTVYAGGGFTTADGSPANYVAQWTGSGWLPLGLGMNSYVSALVVSAGRLYASGDFSIVTNTGGTRVIANHIAEWNGNSWSSLGLGMNGRIPALAVSGSTLFAGGTFTMVTNTGGMSVPANYIAKWDGSAWSPVGLGMNDAVSALAMSSGTLYAGGYFSAADSNPASHVARWNGTNWLPVGSGVNDNVLTMAASDGMLFIGGVFTMATNGVGIAVSANHIARWDGSSWSGLGTGANNIVMGLAAFRGDLFLGGAFTTVGDKVSAYLARAIINEGSVLSLQPGVPGLNTNTLTFAGIPTNLYPVQFATNLTTSPWFTLSTNTANANGRGTVLDSAATNDQRYYRVLTP